jgi:hypothetical protein
MKNSTLLKDLSALPNKVWSEFKQFTLVKKLIIVWGIYFVIESLTKDLSLSKEDLTDNIIHLPKKVWNNFWSAPTGRKFLLVLMVWYIVKNLYPSKETEEIKETVKEEVLA